MTLTEHLLKLHTRLHELYGQWRTSKLDHNATVDPQYYEGYADGYDECLASVESILKEILDRIKDNADETQNHS